MFDKAHEALMPPRELTEALRELARLDPRISALAHAQRGTPSPSALVTLANDRGETTFQMVEVKLSDMPGRLFVGPLPGRTTKVAGELDALVGFGIRHVFGLLPAIDLDDFYRVPTYLAEVRSRFEERFTLIDVIDYEVPPVDAPFEAGVDAATRALVAGDKVYVHCGAGCGRAGVFASCVLVSRGMDPIAAVEHFRAARGCGPETPEQVAYVVRYAARRRDAHSAAGSSASR